MSKQTEALKLALEALEYIHEGANNQGPHTGISWRCVSKKAEPAITAIREALTEKPAPPPECQTEAEKTAFAFGWWKALEMHRKPASKPWVGLSTDEIYDMYNEPRSDAEMVEFARAIEAKLREKNQ